MKNSKATAIRCLGGVHLVACPVEPRPIERADAEHIRAGPRERVPEADAGPEVVFHPRPEDEPIAIVDLEGERLGRVESLEADGSGHLGEERVSHGGHLLRVVRQRAPLGQIAVSIPTSTVGPTRRISVDTGRSTDEVPTWTLMPGSTTRRWSAPT